ncbi:WD domain, G-beta repeat-containing protein [Cardiosporidium cionae]|uniref:WD domain, G-beta repeat-containing protein n=1 Tax=Cardiosporidium cionae TaxID=476202 RepID=A0ABQ7JED3_9APIC|nr:WD domain, G-beta repeat-containing protein [Cardiosporidium cionae]|eukprot:KAF8822358.1 WD domain, G-beta repeat-containing protein [Cardiosporidium cionae]
MKRNGPAWALAVTQDNKTKSLTDVVLIGCWDKTISLFDIDNQNYLMEKTVDSDPLCVTFVNNRGLNFLVACSNKKLTLWNREGIRLCTLWEFEDIVWTMALMPNEDYLIVGGNCGYIAVCHLIRRDITTTDGTILACSNSMANAIITDLAVGETIEIKFSTSIKKIATFKNLLVAQTDFTYYVYQQTTKFEAQARLNFRLVAEIPNIQKYSVAGLMSNYVILTKRSFLQLCELDGNQNTSCIQFSSST